MPTNRLSFFQILILMY